MKKINPAPSRGELDSAGRKNLYPSSSQQAMKFSRRRGIKTKKLTLFLSLFLAIFFVVFQFANQSRGDTKTDQATITVSVQETLSLACDDTAALGNLTPATPVGATTDCVVTTNANGGYVLKVKRDDSDTTIDKIGEATTNITDKTAWDPTANSGAGNAATYSGTGLGFGVYASTATKSTTWWGTGTTYTDANNKYAGFPTAYATIMSHTSYSATSTTTSVAYRLDVGGTQKSGDYDGTITYQAISAP